MGREKVGGTVGREGEGWELQRNSYYAIAVFGGEVGKKLYSILYQRDDYNIPPSPPLGEVPLNEDGSPIPIPEVASPEDAGALHPDMKSEIAAEWLRVLNRPSGGGGWGVGGRVCLSTVIYTEIAS